MKTLILFLLGNMPTDPFQIEHKIYDAFAPFFGLVLFIIGYWLGRNEHYYRGRADGAADAVKKAEDQFGPDGNGHTKK